MNHLHLVTAEDREDTGALSNAAMRLAEGVLGQLSAKKSRRPVYLRVARTARQFNSHCRKRGQRNNLMLSHAEYRLLSALAEWADADLTNSFPCTETIADREGWGLKMVKATLAGLVRGGWLVRHSSGGSKINQFCVPAGAISRYARGWEGPVHSRKRGPT